MSLLYFSETLRSLQNKKISPLKIPNVDWSDIGGLEDLKKEIIRTIELPLKFPHLFVKSGLKRSGFLTIAIYFILN